MRLFRPIILSLLFVITAVLAADAQRPVNVHWTTRIDSVSPTQGTIRWDATIDPGWHIYGTTMPDLGPDAPSPQLTTFTIDPVDGLELVGDVKPSVAPIVKYDPNLEVSFPMWENKVSFTQAFKLKGGVKAVTISGKVRYMACTEQACTPPGTEKFSLNFGSNAAKAPVADTAETPAEKPADVVAETPAEISVDADSSSVGRASASQAEGRELAEQSDTRSELWAPVEITADDSAKTTSSESPWWAILGLGFLGGLVALLTPCVWPMIPMTMSFFLKKGKSRSRAITDAVAYGVSIIIIYLVLGVAITMLFGASKLNDIATSAAFNVIFFILLVVFAVSFFGAFDIKLPSKWSNAIDSKAESTTGFLSIFFMAFTLVLVSFSCTGPIIGTLLVEAASQASIVGPAVGMGGFALGLALPFGLFAFFPSLLKEMPRSGSWLNTVKVVLGFIELILSLKFLSVADLAYGWRILDREIFLALWIVLFILLGVYLLGKIRFPHDSATETVGVGRFFMAVASFAFAVYLLPGMWGAPLKGISAFAPPLTTQDFNLYGGTFREFDNYDEGMRYAAENDLPVIVDFSGYACVNCRKMEGAVFDTPDVRSIIERDYVLIKLMVDDKQELAEPYEVEEYGDMTEITTVGEQWSYLQRHKFGINSQPYYVLLDDKGQPLAPARAYDENVGEFVEWLQDGVKNFKQRN